MEVIITFVGLEVGGKFVVTGDVADFGPHAITDPPTDVPEFRGGEPEGVEIVADLSLVPDGRDVSAVDGLFRHT
jgi:hypothetical protein